MKIGIAGGGPVGLLCGLKLIRLGFKVEVFEEHEEIGLPQHCAGIVSVETYMRYKKELNEEILKNRLKGIKLGVINGELLEAKTGKTKAVVLDRVRLEKSLADNFMSGGGKLNLKSRVTIEKDRIKLRNFSLKFDLIIDARGVRSYLARKPRGKILHASQYDVSTSEIDEETVEIWFNKKRNPCFFYWICPLGEDEARVGVASLHKNSSCLLNEFTKKRFKKATKIRKKYFGLIVSGPIRPFITNKTVYIGDSAGQSKPLTGGGLCYSYHAIEKLTASLDKNILAKYEDEWFKEWGFEISLQLKLRRVFERLSNEGLSKLMKLAKKSGLIETILERGNMDRLSSTAKSVIYDRRALTKLLKNILF